MLGSSSVLVGPFWRISCCRSTDGRQLGLVSLLCFAVRLLLSLLCLRLSTSYLFPYRFACPIPAYRLVVESGFASRDRATYPKRASEPTSA
ncbi:hypothetical protein BT67DRAFT_51384 [Trichocladium antarcticum]|uniref:Uncharacterized protein n=1 Tax=Trichocladium antarcticum TaxID=1450529 RepID=A0AAN6ZD59_9PEZI|nr:hypothetical protein BT67DRAFT_51384 [Trichocladium antarcticum]